ncbi:DUF493 domain-containing protein [Marivirga sp. S37H4]|uniref:DUF493 domain-containing protein n=1 Tax=Marivirga aurantiaca TaxID=2802615 RepID=A0A934WZB1_9BACT|nr:DUF493 family protein [Marivirga aurantiaca]MBK6265546.1 DUF493 domain-containing protein [Marivirga aurantiaca]
MEDKIESFRLKLEAVTVWPTLYMFKFIVPAEDKDKVKDIFNSHEVKERPSRNGKYVSLTIHMLANSAEQIIDKYLETYKVKGIIAL